MLIIFAQTGNQVRIISILENDRVVMGMGIRLLFREQLDSITSYFVRLNILRHINFRTVFTHFNSHRFPVFFSVIQTDRTQLVEVSRTETNHSDRNNNNPEQLERFPLCRQTETRPVFFLFSTFVNE